MNKKRFVEANAHVFKARQNNRKKGAKFVNSEISFSLTPKDEDFDKILNQSSDQKMKSVSNASNTKNDLDAIILEDSED